MPVKLQPCILADIIHNNISAPVDQAHVHPGPQRLPHERGHFGEVDRGIQEDVWDITPVDCYLHAVPWTAAAHTTATHRKIHLLLRDMQVLDLGSRPGGKRDQLPSVPHGGREPWESLPKHGYSSHGHEQRRSRIVSEGVCLDPHPERGKGPSVVFFSVSPASIKGYRRCRSTIILAFLTILAAPAECCCHGQRAAQGVVE
mmetsp:Transcript_22252/g.47860  ORF Transcript_22252/g.47860 Transcript_22252/m.47860 type:complete len:201 (-) Transcript_22252:540-1142(-)